MYAFIQTSLIYNIAMLVFLTVTCCSFTFMLAEVAHWIVRKRKC